MEDIYEKLRNPNFSAQIYSRKGGEERAKEAINEIFNKISKGEFDLSKTKNVLLNIVSGDEEITIDEIGTINDFIQKELPATNILMGVQDKNISNDIEVQVLFTNLEFDNEKIDPDIFFQEKSYKTTTLPIYLLEEEYTNDEISEMISFLSDLYQDIGGDKLKIRGLQSKLVEFNIEPISY